MITAKLFNSLFPTAGLSPRKYNLVRRRDELIDALNRILPKYSIDNYLRICPFLANCGIETDYFKTTTEYASGWDYDVSVNPVKARRLGNFKKGDGPKYKGSGLSQTTGGFNFIDVDKSIGAKLGIDVVKNPEILRENIDVAVESACIFWERNNLNKYADKGLFKQLSGIVNRGDKNKLPLHWEKRNELYEILKRRIPKEISLQSDLSSNDNNQQNQAVTAIVPTQTDLQSNNAAPLVLTPAEPTVEPSKDDFLAAAFDRNVSADQIKTALPSLGTRIWRYVARPLGLIYAALEAGNVAAWFGIVVLIGIVVYLLYAHRADIKKLFDALKNKFTQ